MTPRAPVPHVIRPRPRSRSRVGRAWETLAGIFAAPFAALGALALLVGALASLQGGGPGVHVTSTTRPGPGDLVEAPSATLFLVGLFERGDTVGVVDVKSMNAATSQLGNRPAFGFGWDSLSTFFGEVGSSRVVVARVVGPAATVGLLTLKDRSAAAGLDTVRIDAANPGAWSSGITVEVQDGGQANTFRILVNNAGQPVEVYDNVPDPATLVQRTATSTYIRATNLASATAAPANNPRVLAATALSAGNDDRNNVLAAHYLTALDRFTEEMGAGLVSIPGIDPATIAAGVLTHCVARNRIAAFAPLQGSTPTQAVAAALALRSLAGAEYAGMFYPWVKISDGAGGTRTIPPGGYVAGVRARVNKTGPVGLGAPWRAPAGEDAVTNTLVGLEREVTDAEAETLNDASVNAIRTIQRRIRLYGWRSLSFDRVNYKMLTSRDTMNLVAAEADRRFERFPFKTIGQSLFDAMEAEARGIVGPIASAGGLYPDPLHNPPIDPGYRIDTSPSVNTPDVIADDKAICAIGMRVSPVGEVIFVPITKVAFQQNF